MTAVVAAQKDLEEGWTWSTALEKDICGFWNEANIAACKKNTIDLKLDLNNKDDKWIYDSCVKVGSMKKKRFCWAVSPSRF